MILENFKHNQGRSCRTVAIRDILERCGLTVKEEFVFGLAGGLSFSYVDPGGMLSENRFFKALAPNLMQFEHFAQNAGIDYHIISESNYGFSRIESMLRLEDNPVICEVSPEVYADHLGSKASLWKELRLDIPVTGHVTEIIGIDRENVYICENYSSEIYCIPKDVFERARDVGSDSYLDPHHRIHHIVLPADMSRTDVEGMIYKAVRSNLKEYLDGGNERLGMKAFIRFMEHFPHLPERSGRTVCRVSLEITGNLIKFVSPGMFRKMYGRFLMECVPYVRNEKEIVEINSLLSSEDYLWNKFAARILKKDLSVEERMSGDVTVDLLGKIKCREEQALDLLRAVFAE